LFFITPCLANNTCIWEDGWNDAPNQPTDSVIFRSGGNMTWDAASYPMSVTSWVHEATFTGTVTVETVFSGKGSFTNLHITGDMVVSNGVLIHKLDSKYQKDLEYRLAVEVDGDLMVGPDGHISANRRGFYYTGPDVATYGINCSHGGIGSTGYRTYGSFFEPITFGSSGDDNGAVIPGGGHVRLLVHGDTVVNGLISSDGGNWSGGRSASGGSIYLTTATCSGTGRIRAGTTVPHGAGGRVAVYVTNSTGVGSVELRANTRGGSGGAGSVYLEDTASRTIYINDWGSNGNNYCSLPVQFPGDGNFPADTFSPDEYFRGVDFVVTNTGQLLLFTNRLTEYQLERYYAFEDLKVWPTTELKLDNACHLTVGSLTVNGTSFDPDATYTVAEINTISSSSLAAGDGTVRVGMHLIHPPATNAGASTATLDGYLNCKSPDDPDVYVCWGLSNGGTDTSSWDNVGSFGTVTEAGALTTNLDGQVTADRTYIFRFYGTNATHDYWSEPVETFLTGDIWLDPVDTNASESPLTSATCVVRRAESATNGPLVVYYDIGGTADMGVDYENLSGIVTIQTEQASVDIVVDPIYDGSPEEETVTLTLLTRRGSYGIHSTSNAETVLIAPETLPANYNAWNGEDPTSSSSWSLEHLPTSTETVYLGGLTNNLVWSSSMTNTVGGWFQSPFYTGDVTVETTYSSYQTAFTNLTILGNLVVSNGVFTHQVQASVSAERRHRLMVTVNGDLVIGPQGHVSGDARGFRKAGAGYVTWSDLLSHAGMGSSGRDTYGSFLNPDTFGGSGDENTPYEDLGGGAVRMLVKGNTQVDGTISANGGWDNEDTGRRASAGSVYLRTAALSGSGTIQASPKAANPGGGRVAVIVTNATGTGSVEPRANSKGGSGGAGSVYVNDTASRTIYINDWGDGGSKHCYLPVTFSGSGSYPASIYAPDEYFRGVDFVVTNEGQLMLHTNRLTEYQLERYYAMEDLKVWPTAELYLDNACHLTVGSLTVNGTSFDPDATYTVSDINSLSCSSLADGDGTVHVGIYLMHQPATNAGASTATLDGYLNCKSPDDPNVYVCWGLSNGGTDTSSWDNVGSFDTLTEVGSLATNLDGQVTANRTYSFRFYGTNATHDYWSEPVETFLTGDVWLDPVDTNASENPINAGTCTVYRHADATNGPLVVYYDIGGSAVMGVNYENLSGVVTIQTAQASADIVVTPIDNASSVDRTVTLTILTRRGSYGIHSTSNDGTVVISPMTLPAGYNAWNGGDPTSDASWGLEHLPTSNETVYLSGLDSNMTWSSSMTNIVGGWVQTATYTATVMVETTYASHSTTFTNLTILGDLVVSNGVITHKEHATRLSATRKYRLMVTVGGALVIGPQGHISGDGGGFYYAGPDLANWWDIASHAGMGSSGNDTYGSFFDPDTFGGSGDDNGPTYEYRGGGVVRMLVEGNTQVDGTISANGTWDDQSTGRRGSGGSVYLRTAALSGSGTIQASPKDANAGGGRVAVIVTNAAGSGSVELRANSKGGSGGAGSVYVNDTASRTIYINDWGDGGTKHCYLPVTFPGSGSYPASIYAPEEEFGGVDFVVTNYGRMTMWTGAVEEFGFERYRTLGSMSVYPNCELKLDNGSTNWVGALTVNGSNFSPNATYSVSDINDLSDSSLATGDGALRVGLYLFHWPATNASTSGATLEALMGAKGPDDPDVYACWGLSNGEANTSNWDTVSSFGTVTEAGTLSTNLDGQVTADKTYFFRFYGTNDTHDFWSEPVETFLAGEVWLDPVDTNAVESPYNSATCVLRRAESATNGPLVVYLEIGGTAKSGTDYQPLSTVVTMQTEQASVDIVVDPINDGSFGPETVTIAIVTRRGSYGIHSTSNNATVIIDPVTLPAGYNAWSGGPPTSTSSWGLDHLPTSSETVYISGLTSNMTWSSSMTNIVGGWIQTDTYVGTVTLQTVFVGQGAFTNLHILGDLVVSNGVMTQQPNPQNSATMTYLLALTVGGDLVVGADGHVSADMRGFSYRGPDYGLASPAYLVQASHGGMGSTGYRTYGSLLEPATYGSSGDGANFPSWSGGGTIRIDVGGASQVDGSITANGGHYAGSRTASGGSIYLTTGTLTGSGTIQASPTVAPAGGGRVAVYVTGGAGFGDVEIRANCLGGASGAGSTYHEDTGSKTAYVNNWGTSCTDYCYVPATFPGDATYPAVVFAPAETYSNVTFVVTNYGRLKLSDDVTVADVYVQANGVLNLDGYDLSVLVSEHDIGSGSVSYNGGNIIWLGTPPVGMMILIR